MKQTAQPANPSARAAAVRRRPSVRATTLKVAALSCAAAVAIGGGLSLQLAHGNDPALGPKASAQTGASSAQVSQGATGGATGASGTPSVGSSSGYTTSSGSTTSSASTPAPVQTSTS